MNYAIADFGTRLNMNLREDKSWSYGVKNWNKIGQRAKTDVDEAQCKPVKLFQLSKFFVNITSMSLRILSLMCELEKLKTLGCKECQSI